jgi:uncharacterized protein DUF6600
MTICSCAARVFGARCATVAALVLTIALPLAASSPVHAQRHAAPQMQRSPATAPQIRATEGQRGPASSASLRSEFRTALEPHGRWQQHKRWGDVWIPANRPRDWRPYTVGRWVYTNDWGWYWASDDAEASWGWVAYHYGRWAYDDDLGWCWIPGDEWGPAWVQWRRSRADVEYVGWSPLPPAAVLDVRARPRFYRAKTCVRASPGCEIRRLLPRHCGRKPDLVGQRSRPLCGEPRHITDLYCRGDAPAVTCVQHSAGCRGRNCANPRRAAGASAGFAGPKLPAKRRHAADPESRARRQSYSAGAAVGSGRARPT